MHTGGNSNHQEMPRKTLPIILVFCRLSNNQCLSDGRWLKTPEFRFAPNHNRYAGEIGQRWLMSDFVVQPFQTGNQHWPNVSMFCAIACIKVTLLKLAHFNTRNRRHVSLKCTHCCTCLFETFQRI